MNITVFRRKGVFFVPTKFGSWLLLVCSFAGWFYHSFQVFGSSGYTFDSLILSTSIFILMAGAYTMFAYFIWKATR